MAHRIVVIGAGYAGLAAAGRVSKLLRGAQVTLVNAAPQFVERVRLHQVAAGQRTQEHQLVDVVQGSGIELIIGRVLDLDAERHELRIDTCGEPLGYDTLVYALGSGADTGSIPGVAEHAVPIAVLDGAHEVRDRIRERDVVTVVGGGLTGIETAAELAETRPELRVRLLTSGELGEALSPRGRAHLGRVFDRLGVEVLAGARVEEVRPDSVALAGGRTVGTDLTIWAAGFDVPDMALRAGIAVDGRGRVVVDGTMRSVSHPDVYAVGDSAMVRLPNGPELRMACATGLPAGLYTGRALAARLAGHEPQPFKYRYFNQCISLGRKDALIQFVDRDDRPHRTVLTGSAAVWYKEFIVRGAQLMARRPSLYGSARRRTARELQHAER